MEKTFVEMKLFQVKPDKLEQFESVIEEVSADQKQCEGCIAIKNFKRFYTIDGIELGEPPRELTKIVKCVKYYSYWEFDTKENDLAKINGLGVSFIRTDFDWGYCQPNKSKPNSFVHHDNMMEAVCNQKLDVLGIFSSPRSRTDKQWDVYVADVVGHYQSSVKYWEVINEADLWHRRQSDFTPEDYVSILKTAYPIIKKENRKAKVLFSGISNVNMGFIEKVFEQNVADYFDIMNIHWYANKNNEPESFFEYFEKNSI